MFLKIKLFVIFITITGFFSCKKGATALTKIAAGHVTIDNTLPQVDSISNYIAPYKKRVNEVLDSTLAYAPKMISKDDGEFNTSAGNLMADIMLSEANPVFRKRTGKDIDFALMNHGGIRSVISEGAVSARTAYEVMPFENSIAVVELSGASVLELVHFLIDSRRAHPIAGMQIMLDPQKQLKSVKIQGEPLNEKRNYFVATSNYLVAGGDDMVFFKDALNITDTDYYIRNAMIDYFKKVDTVKAMVDDRFIKLNE